MNPLRLASTAATVLCLTSLAPAQNLTPYWPQMEQRTWADHALHPGAYGAITTARISSFGYPDVVFLAGTEPMLMVAPAIFDAIVPLPGAAGFAANDVIGLQGGGHDYRLAMVGPTGLALWSGPDPAALKIIGNPSWPHATVVREVLGENLVVGTNTLRAEAVFANTVSGSHSHSWSVPGLLRAVPFDYDGDGADEIGLVTTTGFEVRTAANVPVTSFAGVIHSATAERVRMPNPYLQRDALTALCNVAGNQVLVTISSVHQEANVLGPLGAVGMAVADANADGLEEVMLPSSTRASLDVLFHLGATQVPWFEYALHGGVEMQLPPGTPVTASPAQPLLADFDGDGMPDMVHPVQGTDTILTPRSPLATTASPIVKYTGLGYQDRGYGRKQLYLQLDQTGAPAGASHVELLLYDWNDGSPLSQPDWNSVTLRDTNYPQQSIYSKEFPQSAMDYGTVLVIARYLEIVNGERVHVWPPIQLLATNDQAQYTAFQLVPTSTPSSGSVGGITTGGVNDIKRVPPPLPLLDTDG